MLRYFLITNLSNQILLYSPKIPCPHVKVESEKVTLLIFSILEHLNHKNRDCSINTPHNLLRPKVRQRRGGGLRVNRTVNFIEEMYTYIFL